MATTNSRLIGGLIILGSLAWASSYAEDGYLGILNGNESLINSVSNESSILTGDFSTKSIFGPTESAQWATEGPIVVGADGEILGRLSTVDTTTNSLFNETILEQVPFSERSEACIGSLNDSFSTEGPKIYDSQSEYYKDKIGDLTDEGY